VSRNRLNVIQADLQKAPTVIYLEGKTDEPLMFALAGIARPSSGIHNDVYVKADGGGNKEIRALLTEATANGLSGTLGRGGVFGIVDGDGLDLAALKAQFDHPFAGPLFSWPVYSIENLLALAWPPTWGAAPNWATILASYLPYAALNRVHVRLRTALETLGLENFHNPTVGQPLKTALDVKTALGTDKGLIAGSDVEVMFDDELAAVTGALTASLDEGHALVNGKWLILHHARAAQVGRPEDVLRAEWAAAVLASGGHPLVRDLWTRIAGAQP
jgi:hypothetical protein